MPKQISYRPRQSNMRGNWTLPQKKMADAWGGLVAKTKRYLSYITDGLKLYYHFKNTKPTHLLAGSTSFDGSDDRITVPGVSALFPTDEITMCAWAKFNVLDTNYQDVIDKHSGYELQMRGDNHIRTYIQLSTSGWQFANSTGITLQVGQWYFVVGTYNTTTGDIKSYVDGELGATSGGYAGQTISYTGTNSLGLGGINTGGRYVNGVIANASIFNKELTQSQIQSIMWKNYADLSPDEKTNLVSWWSLANDFTDSHGSNDGTANGGVTAGTTAYGGASPIKPRIQDNSPDALKNYGTIYSGTALDFDGINDQVNVGDIGVNMHSLSIWFDAGTVNASTGGEFITGLAGSSYCGVVLGAYTGTTTDEIVSIVGESTGNKNYYASATDELTGWNHLALSWDSGNSKYKIYLNGEEKTVSTTGTMALINASNVNFGKRNDSVAHWYSGKQSNPLIYDVALTEAQIQELYMNPETVLPSGVSASNLKLWLPFTEGSGTTAYDGSGNGNNGTITGATWSKGNSDIFQTALVRGNVTAGVFYPEGLTAGQDIQGVTLTDTTEIKNGIRLNGNEYVDAGDIGSIKSVGFWVKPDTNGENMINCDGGSHTITASAGTISATGFTSPTIYVDGSVSSTLTADTWQFVTVTTSTGFTASDFKTYSDYNGLMDEIFVYSDTLTADEITKNYNHSKSKHS